MNDVFDQAAKRASFELTGLDKVIAKLKAKEESKKCIGKVYRCELTGYLDSTGGINFKERYRPLKRLSCPGCEQCSYLEEDLHESLCDLQYSRIIHKGEHGKLYKLKVVNVSHDYETGYVDDWDLEIVEFPVVTVEKVESEHDIGYKIHGNISNTDVILSNVLVRDRYSAIFPLDVWKELPKRLTAEGFNTEEVKTIIENIKKRKYHGIHR